MHVAIEGCCHGELDAIYASIARAEQAKGFKVDLLLICGDFQALRNPHDFESLAVPAKFRALGSFHSYYSGAKVAPVLTLVIGGNHEASNYMWELYHGGWLAPNIYYLGASGSVLIDGLRVSGASGIFKSHDYHKGFYETVPYDRSTLRSVYHIRSHSVQKLALLPPSSPFSSAPATTSLPPSPSPFPPCPHPSIFLSHDWPLEIASSPTVSCDLPALLRRKPFFADEIRERTLGSPPLLELLKTLRPTWWFAAHLHVKFAAVWTHGRERRGTQKLVGGSVAEGSALVARNPDEIVLDDDDGEGDVAVTVANPDEIPLDDDDDDDEPTKQMPVAAAASDVDAAADKVEQRETAELVAANPDEITLEEEDDDDEPPHRHEPNAPPADKSQAPAILRTESSSLPPSSSTTMATEAAAAAPATTKFLALDKCLPNKDFLQILEIPTPLSRASPSTTPPRLTYDPHWLAITRAAHPYLSLSERGGGPGSAPRMPTGEAMGRLVQKEMEWVEQAGLGWTEEKPGEEGMGRREGRKEVKECQRFWRTAPALGEVGGGPAAWYTNPQTIALTDLLGLENKVNPFPPGFEPGPLPWLVADAQAAEAAAVAAEGVMDGLQQVEAEMERVTDAGEGREQQPQEPMGLSDAELGGRWTEGSG